jgi:hypothetical protein
MVLNGSIAVNPPEITITSGTPRRMLTRTGNAASSETHVSPYFGPSVVRVEGGAKVVFQDIAITGGMIRGLGVYGGGNMVTLNNTEISGKASYGANSSTHIYGGGVLLSNSADPPSKITMNGGSIYGEDNLYGKDNVQLRIHGYGVAIKNDQYATDCTEFEMNGGTIYGKATTNEDFGAYSSGGGVYLYGGTFTMTDATIYGDGVHDGGGVYIRNGGSFTMYGASRVSGGVDSDVGHGGGVYLYDGTFTMNDYSTINGSSAYWIGGGVFIQCPYPSASFTSFTMNDHSTVSGNTAVQLGGGVYQAGNTSISSFKMNDDSAVSGNTAGERGGGVYLEDGIELWDLQPIEFEMHGNSVIYGSGEADETLQNTAPEGAAMYHKYHSTEDNRYDFEVLTPIETTLNAGNYLDWLEWE